jgi:hypothetical protein
VSDGPADERNARPPVLFAVSDGDLAAADDYEVADYRPITVSLRSGKQAWVSGFAGPTSG